ncbi:hypothetical protein C7K25_00175 [Gulosibacter molinativorax]|uniref:Uncharacterized protein n=1 Tax=Gulosibacter molinativorax TaxID=256821 RepID=A0ABT7C3G0_9MICO|nr:hypothetical protein [Gulosibacter molinativorax]
MVVVQAIRTPSGRASTDSASIPEAYSDPQRRPVRWKGCEVVLAGESGEFGRVCSAPELQTYVQCIKRRAGPQGGPSCSVFGLNFDAADAGGCEF